MMVNDDVVNEQFGWIASMIRVVGSMFVGSYWKIWKVRCFSPKISFLVWNGNTRWEEISQKQEIAKNNFPPKKKVPAILGIGKCDNGDSFIILRMHGWLIGMVLLTPLMDLLAGWYEVLFILVSNSSYVFWLFRGKFGPFPLLCSFLFRLICVYLPMSHCHVEALSIVWRYYLLWLWHQR